MAITNTQLASDLADLIASWQINVDERQAWLSGTAGGGPNSDGTYPLTAPDGTVYNVKCPAQLQADLDALTDPAGQYTTAAEAAEANAAAHEANAAAEATLASQWAKKMTGTVNATEYSAKWHAADAKTQKDAAETAKADAEAARDAAQTSESNAAASESNAATSETNAAISEANAATSESNAAASASAAATSESNAATSEANAAQSATDAQNAMADKVDKAGDTMTGELTVARKLSVTPQDGINEGGEIELQGAGSYADWYLDVFQGYARFFSDGVTHFEIKTDGAYVNSYKVWHEGNDGAGSGLDADKLQGKTLQEWIGIMGSMEMNEDGAADSVVFIDMHVNNGGVVQDYDARIIKWHDGSNNGRMEIDPGSGKELRFWGNVKMMNPQNQDAWTNVTLFNAWVNDSGHPAASYYKDSHNRVHFRGQIKDGAVGNPAFYLPVGYRPAYMVTMPVVSSTGDVGRIDVWGDGAVVPQWPSVNTWVNLLGVSFRID